MNTTATCKICRSPSSLHSKGKIEGYRSGVFFDIIECSVCDTSYTSVLEPDEKIYEAIYKNVSIIPGYSRYLNYAQQSLKEKDPLGYLMKCDDSYYGIAQTILDRVDRHRSDILIWEVGCGQGYLTYALSKAGFGSIGLDISATAVASAKDRFGNLYFCEDVKTHFLRTNQRPSFIVLSEVIEHIEDPESFISELMQFVRPGGAVIVTTPNKAHRQPTAIWDTELPPVHLWWFSSKGLEAIGKNLHLKVEFANLSEFYANNLRFRQGSGQSSQHRAPILDKEYNVMTSPESSTFGISRTIKSLIKRTVPNRTLREIQLRKGISAGLEECTAESPLSLCAIYSSIS